MDQIDFEPPERSTCACCGKATTCLTRFVTRDGAAFAVYYVKFTEGHDDRVAYVMVGLGDWSEDAVAIGARTAFTFCLRPAGCEFRLSLIDPDVSPWTTSFLGKKLKPAESRAHPLVQEVYDLADHMMRCDEPLMGFFSLGSGSS
jgi:hypothetical protein